MEETIDLREYFAIIKKRAWIIVLITLVAMISSAVVSFFVLDPVYQTNTTMMVSKEKADNSTEITGDDINVNQKLAVTYGEIIKSRVVLDNVISTLGLDMTASQLSGMINVSSVNSTEIINISVEGTNPQQIYEIANALPQVFAKEVKRITKADSVEIIDVAIVPTEPIKPNKIMNIAIAAVLGVMIGLFIIFVLEYMDKKIKRPEDIEKHLGLTLLGVVPDEDIKKK